jgi:hypothetical protein
MASKIIDSTGKTVGTFISFFGNDTAFVNFKVSGKNYIMPVFGDKIGEEENLELYYDEPNCSGQAYVAYNPDAGLVLPYYNLSAFGWINRHPDGVTPQIINVLSISTSEVCTSLTDDPEPFNLQVITLEEALGPDFRAGFTPPFRFDL